MTLMIGLLATRADTEIARKALTSSNNSSTDVQWFKLY
jgi:hypothetical protein